MTSLLILYFRDIFKVTEKDKEGRKEGRKEI
jgi:hypothetical protein